jgi:hypothetical protein
MGDLKISGPAAQQLAALPRFNPGPRAAAPGIPGYHRHIGVEIGGGAAFAVALGSLLLKNRIPFLARHLDHGPAKWVAVGTVALGAAAVLAGCGGGAPETVPKVPPITPAELNQRSSIVTPELTLGTYQHERGFVPDDQTKLSGSNATSSSDSGSSTTHYQRNFLPDSTVLAGTQDDSKSVVTFGSEATSGHIDHTKVIAPLKTVQQLGLPAGYGSVDQAIQDVYGLPQAQNGFAVIKDGDAYKAEAFATAPNGIEWIKPDPDVQAVVLGNAVLTPAQVNGSTQLQESGHVQVQSDAAGLPDNPTYGLAGEDGNYVSLGRLDRNNPSAGYGTFAEALGAAQQVEGLQAVVANSNNGRYYLKDLTGEKGPSSWWDGEDVPGTAFKAMDTEGGYMVPSSTGKWRDPSTFKSG